MKENENFDINKFALLDCCELQEIEGGIVFLIPVGYVVFGGAFALGATIGTVIGLSYVNRH